MSVREISEHLHRSPKTIDGVEKALSAIKAGLEKDGINSGDRVATMAWNTWRHLEVWYGILGMGAVYHTLNPRLFPDQIAFPSDECIVRDVDCIRQGVFHATPAA